MSATRTAGRSFLPRACPASARFPGFPEDRERRDEDDRKDDEREVLLHGGDVAEEVAREHADRDPQRAADHVVGEEDAVVHRADSRDERREGADDRDDAGADDRHRRVLLVERPGREEERVPGQERRHDEAGLAEDDAEEDDVRERSVVADDLGKVPVEVQEDVHQLLDEVHRGSFDGAEINRKGPSAPIMGPCCASRTSSRKSSPTTRASTRTCCAARTWSRRTSTATSFAPRASPTSSIRSPSP